MHFQRENHQGESFMAKLTEHDRMTVGHNFSHLLNVLHPLGHLLVAHVVDILDEGVVLLPESHPEAGFS